MKCRCINFYFQTVGIIVLKLQSRYFGINDKPKFHRIVMKIGYYTIEKFEHKNWNQNHSSWAFNITLWQDLWFDINESKSRAKTQVHLDAPDFRYFCTFHNTFWCLFGRDALLYTKYCLLFLCWPREERPKVRLLILCRWHALLVNQTWLGHACVYFMKCIYSLGHLSVE